MTRPKRLAEATYVGTGAYFLTFCTNERSLRFTTADAVDTVCAEFLRTAEAEDFAIHPYCFMPDHVHLLIESLSDTADMKAFCKIAKQRAGYAYKHRYSDSLWQDGYVDRILRSDESIASVARYIIENPVRAGLVTTPEEYPFWGSSICSRSELMRMLAEAS